MRGPFSFPIVGLGLMVLLGACRKEDSSNLPENVPIYQDLKVLYDKPENRTRAYATFRSRNALGVRLQLTGGASVTFNGSGYTSYTELDNYFYRWSAPGMIDVQFRFNRSDGGWFSNTITRGDTLDVEIPTGVVISRLNGGQVFWWGRPLEAGERLEAWFRQNGTNSSKTMVSTTGAQSVTIPASVTSALETGTAQLYLNRSRTLPLQSGDGSAGGRRIVEVEASGTVTIE